MRAGEPSPPLRLVEEREGVRVAEATYPDERVTTIRESRLRQPRFEIRTREGGEPEVAEMMYDPLKRAFTGMRGDWRIERPTRHPAGDHDQVVAFYADELRAEIKR